MSLVKEIYPDDDDVVVRYFSPGSNPTANNIRRMNTLINSFVDGYSIESKEDIELPETLLGYLWQLVEYMSIDGETRNMLMEEWNQEYGRSGKRPDWQMPEKPVPPPGVASDLNESPFGEDDLYPYVYIDADIDGADEVQHIYPELDMVKVVYRRH